jgi:hypothetical protein
MSKMHRDLKTQWQIAVSRLGRARKSIIKWGYLLMILYTFGYSCNYVSVETDKGEKSYFGTAITALFVGAGWPLYWSYRLQAPAAAQKDCMV